jgi:transposase
MTKKYWMRPPLHTSFAVLLLACYVPTFAVPAPAAVIRPTAAAVVYLCVAPTDLRKQAASLALLVEQSLKRDIFEAALFVFSNARRDRIRILYWERNGLVLW